MSKEQTDDANTKADRKTERDAERAAAPYRIPIWAVIATPIAAIGASLYTAYRRVDEEFYNKTKREAGVRDLSDVRYSSKDDLLDTFLKHQPGGDIIQQKIDAIRQVAQEAKHKLIAAAERGEVDGKLLHDGIRRIEKTYTKGFDSIIKTIGYKNGKTFEGAFQRYKHLGSDKRTSILGTAIVSSAVALGASFLFYMRGRLEHDLANIHQRIDATQQALDGKDASEKLSSGEVALAREAKPPRAINDNTPRMQVSVDNLQQEKLAIAAPAIAVSQ